MAAIQPAQLLRVNDSQTTTHMKSPSRWARAKSGLCCSAHLFRSNAQRESTEGAVPSADVYTAVTAQQHRATECHSSSASSVGGL